jgi:hypothetical protein
LGKALARNKAKGVKMTTDIKILLLIQKYHRYFGIAALLSAFAHAAVQFSQTGLPSLTGATLVTLLIAQGVSGYMVETKKGNQKIANLIVPEIADWCAVSILEGNQLKLKAVSSRLTKSQTNLALPLDIE